MFVFIHRDHEAFLTVDHLGFDLRYFFRFDTQNDIIRLDRIIGVIRIVGMVQRYLLLQFFDLSTECFFFADTRVGFERLLVDQMCDFRHLIAEVFSVGLLDGRCRIIGDAGIAHEFSEFLTFEDHTGFFVKQYILFFHIITHFLLQIE